MDITFKDVLAAGSERGMSEQEIWKNFGTQFLPEEAYKRITAIGPAVNSSMPTTSDTEPDPAVERSTAIQRRIHCRGSNGRRRGDS